MKLCNIAYILALSFFCCLRGVISSCETRTLHITVDNTMELYIDGIQSHPLPNANNWTKADSVVLPCNTSVIAVKGTDAGTIAGILASTDDGFILTNCSWKCTNVYYEGWQLVGYDDWFWPSAHIIAVHQMSPWKLIPGIRTDAYWIWTPKYKGGDLTVYCRKDIDPSIPPPQCPPRKLTITVGDKMRLYIDGIEKTGLVNANDWTKADTVDLPLTAKVIAVRGTNDYSTAGGILASTDDGFILTNSLWKCTNVYYEKWQWVGFDDSTWPSARDIAIEVSSNWALVQGIRTDAKWIWTPEYKSGDMIVYCRKDIVPAISPPQCPSRELTITVDDKMRLYIDGTEQKGLANVNIWHRADAVELPWTARVIAVQGFDHGEVAGILASTYDGFILTDSLWKCTDVFDKGWELVGFDDRFWDSAHVIGVNHTSPRTLVSGIRTDAQWIWTPKYKGGKYPVYCRKNLVPSIPPSQCPSRKLTIEVQDKMLLYIDGIEKTGLVNANDWQKVDTVELPWTARVIAVQGTNDNDFGGISASTDDGFILTNSLWKCSDDCKEGWQLVGFDDSSWNSADERRKSHILANPTSPFLLLPRGIRTDAYLIWTSSHPFKSRSSRVCCRKEI